MRPLVSWDGRTAKLGTQTMILTDAYLQACKPPVEGRIEIADTRCIGLAFRVTKTGGKSWCFRFRDPRSGKSTRIGIGPYPAVSLAKARERGKELQGTVAAGQNPVTAKRRDRVEAPQRTFAALAERYMSEHAERKKRSAPEDRRNLDLHVLPKWKSRPYDELARGDLVELVEGLIADGKPTLANRVHALCSKIGNFAVDAGLLNGNPFGRVAKRGVENIGRRALSDDEIPLFWSRIVLPPVSRRVGLALRLALLTGTRAGEVAGMMRSELTHLDDAARAAWIIPSERVKNGRAHYVPLCKLARDTVKAALELIGDDDEYVFRSPSAGEEGKAKAIEGHALAVAMRRFTDNLKGNTGAAKTWKVEPPSPHDLRRTVRTGLSALGVRKEDADAVMNHTPAGVGAKHYDLYDRAKEKRQALELWAAHLLAAVTRE
jgi:integrase